MFEVPGLLYTADDLLHVEGDDDYELDRGVLIPVTRTSTPQAAVCSRLDRRIGAFVEAHSLGETFCNDPGFWL